MSASATASAIGALEHIDAAKRLEALSLVRDGRVYDLARVLDESVPVFPGRSFHHEVTVDAVETADPRRLRHRSVLAHEQAGVGVERHSVGDVRLGAHDRDPTGIDVQALDGDDRHAPSRWGSEVK